MRRRPPGREKEKSRTSGGGLRERETCSRKMRWEALRAAQVGGIGRRKENACRRSVRAAKVEDSRETAAAGSRKENAGRGKVTRMCKRRATA